MSQQVWLVTGCSTGFGEQFIKTIIERGDKAIATARKIESIKHLADLGAATMQLDMTDSQEVMNKKAKQAFDIYGRIDVLVQNAGYGYMSTLEDFESAASSFVHENPQTYQLPEWTHSSNNSTPSSSVSSASPKP